MPPFPAAGTPDREQRIVEWRRQMDTWWDVGVARSVPAPQEPPTPTRPPRTAYDDARERWERLYHAHHDVLRTHGPRPWEMPAAMTAEDLRRLVVTLLEPRSRAVLREVLLDLLADDITDITLAITQESAA